MDVSRYFFNNRLVYYIQENTFDWDTHWANLISPSLYPAESQGLGMLSFLSEFLPRNGRILEAGCGMGYVVHELCLQGFKCEGVDTTSKTIQKINELAPFLSVRFGDVLKLNCPDSYYNGYISLGVVEHRIEGPEPFFAEAYRVLTNGGTAIFSVPYCNTIRAIKAKINCYPPPPPCENYGVLSICFY
jgi:SAM-dependent methyltransferase